MKNLAVLILAVGTVIAVPLDEAPKGSGRPNIDVVNYYNCVGKGDGKYSHPSDCTRFIMCTNGRAVDMACADCDINNPNGCRGSKYLVYDEAKKQCEWPNLTKCHTSGPAGPLPSDSNPAVAPTNPVAPPAVPPTNPIAPPAPDDCSSHTAGSPCDPENCDQCNYCVGKTSFYYRCARQEPDNPTKPATGTWILEHCADGDFVDDANILGATLKGGQCTPWDLLHDEAKTKYRNDKKCIPDSDKCQYGQDTDQMCSPNYWYKKTTKSPKDQRSCPTGNIWDRERENCRPCKEVDSCKNHATCTK